MNKNGAAIITGLLVLCQGAACRTTLPSSSAPLSEVSTTPAQIIIATQSVLPGQTEEAASETPEKVSPSILVSEEDGMEMVLIPDGSFMMGSEDGDPSELPLHKVSLDAFYLDQYEVTYAQFEYFLDVTGYEAYPCFSYDAYPVTCVTWADAQAYCQWAGRRLPTEAEWEMAARGGLDRAMYPWGNEHPYCGTPGNRAGVKATANFDFDIEGCGSETAPVGSFSHNNFGVYDMAGNVWEWVADWYGEYPVQGQNNPAGPLSGVYRIIRGGSWHTTSNYLRNAARLPHLADDVSNDIGFRCALPIQFDLSK